MARLSYSVITSLDGYLADDDGAFDWAAPDEEVHTFVNDLERSVGTASSARTQIERDFQPEAVSRLKASAGADISVGGPCLAAQAMRAGLVDECHLFVAPIMVGGRDAVPPARSALHARAAGRTTFGNGMVHLHYRINH